jgi:ferredoxin
VDIGSQIIPKVFISKQISQVDYLINIPKMKTHVLTGISCCIKNLYGYVVGAMKSRYHLEAKKLKRLTQLWLDLYKYRTPDLNIVDGIVAMEGGGPTHGEPRDVRKIIAGKNGFEVDVVLTAMMGWDPKQIRKLTMAHEQGLGEIDPDKIDIQGDFEILPEFKRPPTFSLNLEFNPYEEITKIRPVLDEDMCALCGLCEDEACPAEAIALDPHPIIDEEKCISCYCCVEFCPEGALSVEYDKEIFETA